MYRKQAEPRPSTDNPDGSLNVLVELRAGSKSTALSPGQLLKAPGCHVDASYDPVPMDGGTVIIRCRVESQAHVEKLKQRPGVVSVWPETPIAPMQKR
jgi:hypothetical protein